jgi:hypothetical protein
MTERGRANDTIAQRFHLARRHPSRRRRRRSRRLSITGLTLQPRSPIRRALKNSGETKECGIRKSWCGPNQCKKLAIVAARLRAGLACHRQIDQHHVKQTDHHADRPANDGRDGMVGVASHQFAVAGQSDQRKHRERYAEGQHDL